MAALLIMAPASAEDAPIIMPGAPGSSPQVINAQEAIRLAETSYSPYDVAFMQGMVVHHRQAVEMAALVKGRTNQPAIIAVSERINASQADEIRFMTEWLEARGEPISPMHGTGHSHHGMDHSNHRMKGMLTSDQMAAMAAASGTEFDRLFIKGMIEHHQGAVEMVKELHEQHGSAADPVMFNFTNDVVSDQTQEIDRMNVILAGLSDDPRATLKAGLTDAGEAISNLRLVASLPKPAGFFDPANPAGLRLEIPQDGDKDTAASVEDNGKEKRKAQFSERDALLDFANTEMAFSGDYLIAGSYHGFNAYRLGADGLPTLVSSTVCPGGQGDVSVIGDLLLMSVEDSRGRVDCGLQGVQGRISEERFRGVRIFDISDITRPRQIVQVQTCRGSHTHSIVTADDDTIVVYNSGTSYIRPEEEMAGCFNVQGDDRTALFSIDIIEIPVSNPAAARIIDSPRIFAENGQIAGLWRGGDHGDGTQETRITDHCHDITVFPSLQLAAGACSGNGVLLDISDPMAPKRVDDVTDKGFAYWHSATFNNDGTKVLFTDEWGGGSRPRCQAGDPMNWGANGIYDIVDGKLEFRSLYKIPAPQTNMENCVAHNGSIIPVPGRDIFVQAWYQGGISVIDFTDTANPVEIAYFDRGPISDEQLVAGGYWSAYWYNGRIYATEITRGLDVFALEPSEFLTAEEIAAAEEAQFEGAAFNPQTQTQVTWPEEIVARVEASRKGG
ncbi:DUF305 domain-containing protein [Altererythrobacter sp. GH1-8]|uniref:DUF305 domain-containing protein n=1 Tax=Altererythrobacter sp. GH1-8 TaxID=3349333 RepID=UPI00374DEEA3